MNLWIARDADGSLFVYEKKPLLLSGTFQPERDTYVHILPRESYPNLSHEMSPRKLIIEN